MRFTVRQFRFWGRMVVNVFLPSLWEVHRQLVKNVTNLLIDACIPVWWIMFALLAASSPPWFRVLCLAAGVALLMRLSVRLSHARERMRPQGRAEPVILDDGTTVVAAVQRLGDGQLEVAIAAGTELTASQKRAALVAMIATAQSQLNKLPAQ